MAGESQDSAAGGIEANRQLADRLAEHKILGFAPREELEWLAAEGTLLQLDAEEVLGARDTDREHLWVVLSGRIGIFVERDSAMQKVTDLKAGEVGGLLPYSRMGRSPAANIAEEPSDVVALHREQHRELVR